MQRREAKKSNLFNLPPELIQEWCPWLTPLETVSLHSTNKSMRARLSEITGYIQLKEKLIQLGCKDSDLEKLHEFEKQENKQIPAPARINYLFLYQTLSKMSEEKRAILVYEDLLFLTGEAHIVKHVLDNKNFANALEKQKYIDFTLLMDAVSAIATLELLMQKINPNLNKDKTNKLISDLINSYKNLEKSVKSYPNNSVLFNSGNIVCIQAREVVAELLIQPEPSSSQANLLSQCMNSAATVLKNPFDVRSINKLETVASKAPGSVPSGAWHNFKGAIKLFCGVVLMVLGASITFASLGFLRRIGNSLFRQGFTIMEEHVLLPPRQPQHISAGMFKLAQDAKTHKTEIENKNKKEEKKIEIKIEEDKDTLRTPLLGRNRPPSHD